MGTSHSAHALAPIIHLDVWARVSAGRLDGLRPAQSLGTIRHRYGEYMSNTTHSTRSMHEAMQSIELIKTGVADQQRSHDVAPINDEQLEYRGHGATTACKLGSRVPSGGLVRMRVLGSPPFCYLKTTTYDLWGTLLSAFKAGFLVSATSEWGA